MSEENPFGNRVKTFVAGGDSSDGRAKTRPGDEAPKTIEHRPAGEMKSVELDMNDIGHADTVMQTSTPPPPPPEAAAPVEAPAPANLLEAAEQQQEAASAPALASITGVGFDPPVLRVNRAAKVSVIGRRENGPFEQVTDFTVVILPEGAGSFDKGRSLFTPNKAGPIEFAVVAIDPVTKQEHHFRPDNLEVQEAEPSVVLTPSLAHISQEATEAHQAEAEAEARRVRERLPTVSGSELEHRWHGERPRAMTEGGSPIYPPPQGRVDTAERAAPAPEQAPEQPRHRVIHEMPAARTEDGHRPARRSWWNILGWAAAILFGIGIIAGGAFTGLQRYFAADDAEIPTELPLPAPSVPATTVTAVPAPAPSVPTPEPAPAPIPAIVRDGEPGLEGSSGSFVRASARMAFPTSCRTSHFPAGIWILCDMHERHGADLCDCDVVGFAH
jgi:hypothetical protein